MAGISLYLGNALLNHTLRNSAYSQPAALYLALFTALPGPGDASGNPVASTEVSTAGGSLYARQAITFGAASGSSAANNGSTIVFPTAGVAWGTITYAGIMDASSGPHLLYYGPLTVAKIINAGDTAQLIVGNLTITYS